MLLARSAPLQRARAPRPDDDTTSHSFDRDQPRRERGFASCFLGRACKKKMAPGEVLTLQLGAYANFVGAHFWNLQVVLCL